MLGPAPILDFDGTVAHLGVDWEGVRRDLGIARIEELWQGDGRGWDVVTTAEVEAARCCHPVLTVTDRLATVSTFAIVTSNSARAVHEFLDRFPVLSTRLALVVGRDELGGPKTDFPRFRSALERCLAATARGRGQGPKIYVGDAPYELDFARAMGVTAVDVAEVTLVAPEHDSQRTPT